MRLNERGAISGLLIALIFTSLLLLGAGGFAVWAFAERQDYKNNVDAKVTQAVTVAKAEQKSADDKRFAEEEKNPLKTYSGPGTYGKVTFLYPKTWSAYVDQTGRGSSPLNGYFHPDVVPAIADSAAYALRVEVVNQAYDAYLQRYSSLVKDGSLKANAFAAAKVPDVAGVRLDGQLDEGKTGSRVVLPLRDKTLTLAAEKQEFLNDFNTIILPSLTFSP